MKENLKQLNQGDLKELRAQLHNEQDEICPVLKKKFPIEKMVIDHKHTTSQQTVGKDSNGLVRGCIHFQANSFEGKVNGAYKRLGLNKFDISLPEVLRNLADYLDKEALPLIHPNEKPKEKRLSKSLFNKISKAYSEKYPKRKKLVYPGRKTKSGAIKPPALSNTWLKLMEELNVTDTVETERKQSSKTVKKNQAGNSAKTRTKSTKQNLAV